MDNIPEITVRILNGNQTEEEMIVFMQWYKESAENKELFFQMKNIYEQLKQDHKPDNEEIKESWNRLLKKINSTNTNSKSESSMAMKYTNPIPSKRKNRTRIMLFAGVAAVAAVLITIGVKLNIDNNIWIEVQTASNKELKVVELPDGSTVHLNASTTIKYPKRFNKKSRELYLNGEAYFAVTKNSKHPFIVHADKIDIEVLGTEFNVQSYSVDEISVTTLISGKVKLVTHEKSNNVLDQYFLEPGDQATFDKAANITQVVKTETKTITSWMNGEYSFKNKSLEEITNRLEKIYDIAFVINDETLKGETFTGKFFSEQSIEEIIDIINFKKQFSYEIDNDTIYMKRK